MQIIEILKRNHVLNFCILSFLLFILGIIIPNEQFMVIGIPVSYTHLDVYKRQLKCHCDRRTVDGIVDV